MICIKCNLSKNESNYPLRKRGFKSSTCKNCILNVRREKNKDNQVTKKICTNYNISFLSICVSNKGALY